MKIYKQFLQLKKYKFAKPPINIEGIIEELGIDIHYGNFNKFDGLTINDHGDWYILINNRMYKKRQRFTLAHELKHFLEKEVAFNKKGQHNPKSRIELEANDFAGKLLVPAEALFDYYTNKTKNISELSDIFLVSRQVIEIRLKNIGMSV